MPAERRRRFHWPLHVFTSEQAKILGASLAGITAPLVTAGIARLVAVPPGWDTVVAGSWGPGLVVLLTAFVGGRPDPKPAAALGGAVDAAVGVTRDVAARLVVSHPSDDREEVAEAVRRIGS